MATYHCSIKVGAKGKGGPHADYISREWKYKDVRSNEKLEHVESGNMPAWAENDPAQFWQAADQHERANGATYREIEIALPRELNEQQRLALVRDFVREEIGANHAYTFALHTPQAAIAGGAQPHAHIMYSERTRDDIQRDPEHYFKRFNAKNPEKGGCRKDSAGTEERLQATRLRWATMQNSHLERHGHTARVDHRSLKQQGIERTPEPHLGPARIGRMERMGGEEVAAILEQRRAEGQKERADLELKASIIDLSGDLNAAHVERDRQQQRQAEAAAAERALQFVLQRERQAELVRQDIAQQQAKAQQDAEWALARQTVALAKQESAATAQAEQQRKEQEAAFKKLDSMSAADIRAEIQRHMPPPVRDIVERDPELLTAQQTSDTLTEQWRQAKATQTQAEREMANWRSAHPLRAKTHDAGLMQASFLTEREQIKKDAKTEQLRIAPRIEDATERVKYTRSDIVACTTLEQAPARGKVAALERIERLKVSTELAAHQKTQELDKALSAFKLHAAMREVKAHGYGDSGKKWQAIPEHLRGKIEDFNQLPKAARTVALERLRENMQHNPEAVEKFVQQIEQARERGRDHGMSR